MENQISDDDILLLGDKFARFIGGSGNDEVTFYPDDLIAFARALLSQAAK